MRAAMHRLGGDPKKINPLVPVDLVIDHSVQVDYFGVGPGARPQHRTGVQPQPRAVRVSALGPGGVQQFPRRAAGHGHRPPGKSRIPGQVRLPARRPRRQGRDPRLACGHRQPHHDDRRTGRGRLGRRRHRGRGGHARPADLHAHARSRGHEAHRRPAAWRHGHRPGAHRHANPPQARRGEQVRRVFRRGRVEHVAGRPGDDRQHVARVRRHNGLLSHRRRNAPLPPPHRAHQGRGRAGGAIRQGAGPVPHRPDAGADVYLDARAGPLDRRAKPRRAEAAPGSHSAGRDESRVAAGFAGGVPQAVSGEHWSRALGRGGRASGAAGRRYAGAGGAAGRSRLRGRARAARRKAHRPASRRRRHCRHHQLHQHEQSLGDGRRGAAGQKSRGARAQAAGAREDEPGARQPRGDRLLPTGGTRYIPRPARLQHRGLRLHHLHRQQRAAARANRQGRQRARPGGGGRALAAIAISKAASIRT